MHKMELERERLCGTLLDVDGTLLDSNDAHAMSFVDALSAFGMERSFDEIRPLIGMGGDHVLPRLGVEHDSERGRAILKLRSQIFRKRYLPQLSPFPKARELLERMHEDGLTLVVATSASRDELAPLLEATGIADLVSEEASSDDAEESKPAPDIVQAAVERSGLKRESVVLLGDTPYDIEAARRAGVRVVALRSGGWADAALEGATAIYDDAEDLLRQYDSSLFSTR